MFKLRHSLHTLYCVQVFDALQANKRHIPGIIDICCGANVSPEGLRRGNIHAFTVDFIDAAPRDSYLPNPAHQKVGAMIVAISEGGIDGVTVLDWKM